MEQAYIETISQSDLFSGFSRDELELILPSLNARIREVPKNVVLVKYGSVNQYLYIVLHGEMKIHLDSYLNRDNIIARLVASDSFGHAYCLLGVPTLLGLVAIKDSVVLEIDSACMPALREKAPSAHIKLTQNMLRACSVKIITFTKKLHYMHIKTLRGKLSSYLIDIYHATGTTRFRLPLTQSELADYLCASRASMLRELAKLKEEQIISYHRSEFVILNTERLREYGEDIHI